MVLKVGQRTQNYIAAYEGVSKRTKKIALVKTTDVTAAGTGIGTYTVACRAKFEADSDGSWYMDCYGQITGTGAARTSFDITFLNVTFNNDMSGNIPADVEMYAGGYLAVTTAGLVPNSNVLQIVHPSASATDYEFSFRVALKEEPTAYTTAANLETRDPSQYLNEASDTVVGLVGTGAQTFTGVKTFSNGINVGESDLTYYKTGTFSPTFSGINANPSITCRWTRVGEVVTLFLPGNWTETSNNTDFILNNLPSDIQSSSIQNGDLVAYTDNGTIAGPGLWYLNASSASLNLYRGISGGTYQTWTSSGNKGIPAGVTMTWTIT